MNENTRAHDGVRVDVGIADHEGETVVTLTINDRTVALTKTQAKHLARLLNSRADGKTVYSQQRISETARRYADQILHDFIPQNPQLTLGGRILTSDLINHYHLWMEEKLRQQGIGYRYPVSSALLGRAMRAAGFHMKRSSGKRYYVGISASPHSHSTRDHEGVTGAKSVTDGAPNGKPF